MPSSVGEPLDDPEDTIIGFLPPEREPMTLAIAPGKRPPVAKAAIVAYRASLVICDEQEETVMLAPARATAAQGQARSPEEPFGPFGAGARSSRQAPPSPPASRLTTPAELLRAQAQATSWLSTLGVALERSPLYHVPEALAPGTPRPIFRSSPDLDGPPSSRLFGLGRAAVPLGLGVIAVLAASFVALAVVGFSSAVAVSGGVGVGTYFKPRAEQPAPTISTTSP